MAGLIERLKRSVLARFFAKYGADRADDGAVLIAWTALFSLFPLIIGLLAVFGFVMRSPDRLAAVMAGVQALFPTEFADMLGFLLETRELSGLLGLISLAGLLWSGSALFGAMSQVFNRFYAAPDRGFVSQRIMSFAMMAVYVVLVLVSVLSASIPTFLISLSEQVLPFQVPGFAVGIGLLVALVTALTMFLALYYVVPNVPLQIREVWPGALLGGTLFVILNQIFPLYLQLFGGGFAAYKTLGLFLLLMTWFYLLARIIVLGAELNAFLTSRGTDPGHLVPSPDVGAPGRADTPPATSNSNATPGRLILWAGLTAGVAGLSLAAARRAAAIVWRGITGEDPPSR